MTDSSTPAIEPDIDRLEADIAADSSLPTWTYPVALNHIRGEWLSLDWVAKGCGVNERTVRRWLDSGRLPGYVFAQGARTVVRIDDLRDFLEPTPYPVKSKAKA